MKCPSCGKHNRGTARYCNACGAALPWVPLGGGEFLQERRYEVEKPLKSGGMGSVYLVYDHRLRRRCALKELMDVYIREKDREYAMRRFETEATLLANLVHTGLPRVTDYFTEGARYFLAMDYIEGSDLLEHLETKGSPGLREKDVARIALQVLDVLGYLHGLTPPVIYRDLKPENLMLTPEGKVFIVDFGIARMLESLVGAKKTPIGTQGYAPLEQAQGRVETRSDLYSLGATMYHLLTGIAPVPFNFPPIRSECPHVTREMESFLAKALKLLTGNRFQTAPEMAAALEAMAKKLGYIEPHPPPAAVCSPPSSAPVRGAAAAPSADAAAFVNPRDGAEMLAVEEGEYLIGSRERDDESPPHVVRLKRFSIARMPVTNEQFEEFVSHSGYKPRGEWRKHYSPGLAQYPAVGVTWGDAQAYCAWAGLRLPTEAEWEAAARGVTGLRYPWGDSWEEDFCNGKELKDPSLLALRAGEPMGVGTLPCGVIAAGVSSCGALDMLGNVWEWCSSLYRPYPYCAADGREDPAGEENRVLRGGCWKSDRSILRASARRYWIPFIQLATVGFRTAR